MPVSGGIRRFSLSDKVVVIIQGHKETTREKYILRQILTDDERL